MDDINVLVKGFIDNKTYLFTTIDRHCSYILDSLVTHEDCSQEELTTLQGANEELMESVLALRENMQETVFPGYRAEQKRREDIDVAYQAYLKIKEEENAEDFENRTQLEAEIKDQAIENRDFVPTPLPEYCVCPSPKSGQP